MGLWHGACTMLHFKMYTGTVRQSTIETNKIYYLGMQWHHNECILCLAQAIHQSYVCACAFCDAFGSLYWSEVIRFRRIGATRFAAQQKAFELLLYSIFHSQNSESYKWREDNLIVERLITTQQKIGNISNVCNVSTVCWCQNTRAR